MKTLVFLEHHAGALTKASLGVLAKAGSLGGDVVAVLAGAGVGALAAEAGRFGAATVFLAEDERLAAPLPQPRVDIIARLVRDEGIDTLLFAQSVLASDIAAALSVRLEAGLNWDLVDLVEQAGTLVGKRPALADSVWVDVGWISAQRIAVFRSGAFDPVETGGSSAVRTAVVEFAAHSLLAELVEPAEAEASGPSIEDAEIVVAGGRGLGGAEGFALVESLAEALGGAVGATRAVVDAGWYAYSAQIGQTGKTVSPKLYVAVGISGAIQHKVGMQASGVIVAINKDPHAPIFEYADLGVIGDLNQIVPKLAELVRQRKST
jgi:electron transfer flavoprotein alpha subunit